LEEEGEFMQLNKLVNFHKILADPTRIKILRLLADGPLHGQAIAGKLGLKAPTITHHMAKLREVALISERREKNTIYFYLNEKTLQQNFQLSLKSILKPLEKEGNDEVKRTETNEVIKNFFTIDGKLKNIPSQRKKKLIVFTHLVKGLKAGVKYREQEINDYIKNFHEDFATIRREFIMNHFMYRENGIYELNPTEMWAKPE
jgi:DNA-binding MarR family transcriptional regulator